MKNVNKQPRYLNSKSPLQKIHCQTVHVVQMALIYFDYFMCFLTDRYANPGHVAVGHAPDVGQRPAALLLRFLHLRYRRRSTVGRHSAPALLPRTTGRRSPTESLVSCLFLLLNAAKRTRLGNNSALECGSLTFGANLQIASPFKFYSTKINEILSKNSPSRLLHEVQFWYQSKPKK